MSAEIENEKPDAESEEQELPDNLNDAGKAALVKERDARKAAAKEAREAKAELETLRAQKAEADAAKLKAEEADAIKRGEFEKLATARAEEITKLTGDRDATKAQLASLIESIKPEVDTAWKALPEEVAELFDGDASDVLAKKSFMASHKKLIDKLTATKEEENDRFRRVPNTPRPNPKAKDDIQPLVPAKF
jgi:F0F1-type ATP synthase membrane subunit b/b'